MNRTVIVAVAGTVATAAALVAKVALVPLTLVAGAAWFFWGRRAHPIASASSSRRWLRWMLAGGLAIVAAAAIPAIDGGELNQLWWTVTAVALLSGIGMAATAVVLAASDRAHRRLAAPH
jgi:cytochrome bd-type quinol oxidase subunit 2